MRFAIARLCLLTAVCILGQARPATAQLRFLPHRKEGQAASEKKKPTKVDFLYLMSQGTFAGATWFDGWTTERGLRRYPTVTEGGWARCFGNRNAFAVTAANVALNLGVEDFSRRLYRRGGRWRFVAIGVVVAKTASGAIAGADNFRLEERMDDRMHQLAGTTP